MSRQLEPSTTSAPPYPPITATRPVAVIVSGWPRVSETFALHELQALRDRGLLAAVFATKAGDTSVRQPGVDALADLVTVLPDTTATEQGRLVAEALRDRGVRAVHGYFAHRPAEIARIAAEHLGVPYGFSAHALDVRKVEPATLHERAARAALVVCCNRHTATALTECGADATVLPHGVDLERFRPPTRRLATDSVRVLAVGRLVPKKGFDVLIEAVAATRTRFTLDLIGDGPELARLERLVARRSLHGRVRFLGRRTHAELPAAFATCDVVVAPSVIDDRGDRDGLPNVVLEAMASGCAVVASDVAAIATAIDHGTSGVLVPARDAEALARAIDHLVLDPHERARLGRHARRTVEGRFALDDCSRRFCDLVEATYV